MKTVAVIGSGISGLAAASLLSRRHRVDLFEQDRRLGGHTNTVPVDGPNDIHQGASGRSSAIPRWSRIDVRRADYRELTGQFDKVVSIEMFEAVGLNHYDEYFTAVDRAAATEPAA